LDFIQWWQTADFAQKATVIGALAAVIALVVGFFAKGKIIGKNGSVVSNTIKGSTITTNAPAKKTDASDDKT